MFTVAFFVWGENEEVVHVDDEPPLSDHVSEGVIHKLLECGQGVGESKKHDRWLKKPFMGDEGSFPLVTVFGVNIVIAPSDVKLGK